MFEKLLDEGHHHRARALLDILRMIIRDQGLQEYKLNLNEMYLLIDYFSDAHNLIDKLGVQNRDD